MEMVHLRPFITKTLHISYVGEVDTPLFVHLKGDNWLEGKSCIVRASVPSLFSQGLFIVSYLFEKVLVL